MASIYGIPHDPIREQYMRNKTFTYLKAKIEAEKLNPEGDFDGAREFQLLREIAVCDCDYWQRAELVKLMDIQPKDDD